MTAPPPLMEAPAPRDSTGGRDAASAGRALAVVIGSVAVLAVMYAVFVRTGSGQRLDQVASRHVWQAHEAYASLRGVLRWVTLGLITVVPGVWAVIVAVRRRWIPAVGALVLVAGANLTTEVLKHVVLTRPDLGYGAANSLPSGHITAMTSFVLAVLLVAPRSGRWLVELAGSVGVAVVGVGAVVATWHYPSDIIAGLAVSLAWGACVLAAISIVDVAEPARRPRFTPVALALGLVVAAGIFVVIGVRPGESLRDLAIFAATLAGLAIAGAFTVGVFARMLDARVT